MAQLQLGGDVRDVVEIHERENVVPIIHAQHNTHILLECHRERALCGAAFSFSSEFVKSSDGSRKYSSRFKRERRIWQSVTCKNCQRMARRRYASFIPFEVWGWQLSGLGKQLYENALCYSMRTCPSPWLVLADWLDDQDDPCGQRIRVHCELLSDGISVPHYVRLAAVALDLLQNQG